MEAIVEGSLESYLIREIRGILVTHFPNLPKHGTFLILWVGWWNLLIIDNCKTVATKWGTYSFSKYTLMTYGHHMWKHVLAIKIAVIDKTNKLCVFLLLIGLQRNCGKWICYLVMVEVQWCALSWSIQGYFLASSTFLPPRVCHIPWSIASFFHFQGGQWKVKPLSHSIIQNSSASFSVIKTFVVILVAFK